MNQIIESRIKKIFDKINDKEVSHLLIKNDVDPYIDSNFFYLTGATSGIFEDSFVLASREGEVKILTSALEAESARDTGLEVISPDASTKKDFYSIIEKELKGHGKIGLNYTKISTTSYLQIKGTIKNKTFTDVGAAIEAARIIKDESELKLIGGAARIAGSVFDTIKESIKSGITENELSALIDYNMERLGASGPSFQTICAFGKNSAEPHYFPHAAVLKAGDFVLCDYGAKYSNYCSDMTRTFFCGKPNEEQKNVYKTVLAAQKAALEKIKPGVEGQKVYDAANSVINEAGYKGCFIHDIGHSLGLNVHDSTMFRPFKNRELAEGMVLTIEPGIYISGVGGTRIEDDIVVTSDGYSYLTKAPKELDEITIS